MYEVELDPNNSDYSIISDKITITDNIFEFQEGELFSINDNSKNTISFQIDNLSDIPEHTWIDFRLKDYSQPNGDSHVYMSGIQIPSLFDSSVDYFQPYINNFNPDIELNILDADTLEFTVPVTNASGDNLYNDTSLVYEVELDPNNPDYSIISDKITITDNIFEFQEGELFN